MPPRFGGHTNIGPVETTAPTAAEILALIREGGSTDTLVPNIGATEHGRGSLAREISLDEVRPTGYTGLSFFDMVGDLALGLVPFGRAGAITSRLGRLFGRGGAVGGGRTALRSGRFTDDGVGIGPRAVDDVITLNPAAQAARGADNVAGLNPAAAAARGADNVVTPNPAAAAARSGTRKLLPSTRKGRVAAGAAAAAGLAGVGMLLSSGDDSEGATPHGFPPLDDDVLPPLPLLDPDAVSGGRGGGAGGGGRSSARSALDELLADIDTDTAAGIAARAQRYQDILDADYGQRFLDESAERADATAERVQLIRDLIGPADTSTAGGRVANLVRAASNAQREAIVNKAGLAEAGMTGDRFWADELARSSGATLQAAMLLADQQDQQTAEQRKFELESAVALREVDHQNNLQLARMRSAGSGGPSSALRELNYNSAMTNYVTGPWTEAMNGARAGAMQAGVEPALISQWIDSEFANVPQEFGLFGPQQSAAGAAEVLGRLNGQISELSSLPVRSKEQDTALAGLLDVRPFVQGLAQENYNQAQRAQVAAAQAAGI